jgi:hypothetical protein
MAKMLRNKAKAGIDRVSRGARKAADTVADANDKNKRRAGTKVKAAAERVGDKVKQAGRAVKDAGSRAKAKAKARARR